ncbi:MAG: phosphoenolpyruvate synthase [bacterium]
MVNDYVLWLDKVGMHNLDQVGGKNASLGEMIANLSSMGVSVPGGFATTASAFKEFLSATGLDDKIQQHLSALDIEDVNALAKAGSEIRQWILETSFPEALNSAIETAWKEMTQRYGDDISVAVRSSATAEDLPDASFAGQQETFLNISGLDNVKEKIHEVFASLYNDRAISYRVHQGFAHEEVALSAGIQLMVRSDCGASGVLFTLDTESGFRDVVFITSSYGLGEMVVQGAVNPDEFYVFKPSLKNGKKAVVRRNLGGKAIQMVYNDDPQGEKVKVIDVENEKSHQFSISDEEAEELARQALIIENHYGRPMDIEWGKDGIDQKLYILQARPETVRSRDESQTILRYVLNESGEVVAEGRSIGQKIGQGKVRVLDNISQMDRVETGDVLVTDMTDPDWEPVMKRASAIVTNRGGRTCHAAIIARELGIPAVVGCGNATDLIVDGSEATVSCAEGDTGFIYSGLLDFTIHEDSLGTLPNAPTKIMMNVGNPDRAFDFARIPNFGVGLARLEFIINRMIGVHPRALLEFDQQTDDIKEQIERRIRGYSSPRNFYVQKLAEGISTIACAFAPEPVIVRLSDFKSNEYANLVGGTRYEPEEENPMLGFRGASRYASEDFSDCFAMECEAMKYVREDMGLDNVWAMIPFVRTVDEAKSVIQTLDENNLRRGENGLKVIMMCELPSNALLADKFLEHFDGFSIGSNDLTQLTLGLDRDSGLIADKFDERNPAIKMLLSMAIRACRNNNKYVGICGQGPSDHPDLAEWLVEEGIESMSLNPDTVISTWLSLANK